MSSALPGHALVLVLQFGRHPCSFNCLCLVAMSAAAMTVGVVLDIKAATMQCQSTAEGET